MTILLTILIAYVAFGAMFAIGSMLYRGITASNFYEALDWVFVALVVTAIWPYTIYVLVWLCPRTRK